MKRWIAMWTLGMTVLASGGAFAQGASDAKCKDQPAASDVSPDHVFCFPDSHVNGAIPSPQGRGIGHQPRGVPVNLIRHRNNFVQQTLKSVENL